MGLNETAFIRRSLAAIICIFIGYVFFEYLIPLSLPFLFAFLISKLVRPFSLRMRKVCPRLDKPLTVIALVFVTALICVFARLIASVILSQLADLIKAVSARFDSGQTPLSVITEKIMSFANEHPALEKILSKGFEAGKLESAVNKLITALLGEIGAFFAGLTRSFVSGLPSVVLSFFVTLSASLYLSLDRGETAAFLSELLPSGAADKVKEKRKSVSRAATGYMKTYLLMMLIVFSILYFGFTVIGIDNALVKAMLVAVVDLLPVLGVGTVLVPWSILCLISGDLRLGAGLLVILAVVTLVRQFAEPKIVGKYIGVPPVIALASVYVGTKLCGVKGLILFPILTSIAFAVIGDQRRKKTPTEVEV